MKKTALLLAMLPVIVLAGSNALAGNRPGAVTFSLGDSYYHFADKRNVYPIMMPNIALAYDFDERWAVEGGIGLINADLKSPVGMQNAGVHGFLYTIDGLYRLKSYKHLEPYVSAGIGATGMRPNGLDSEFQGNVNAGFGAQLFATDSIAFRADARDVYTIIGGKNDYMINVGMSFLFGG